MKSQKLLNKLWLAVLAMATVVTAFSPVLTKNTSALESWGPQDRATFTWESPATYRTFNSVTNNPVIGDERNFVRVKEVGVDGPHYDSVKVSPGKEYEVYVYFHNNASASLNASGAGIADNVRLSTKLPEKIEAGQTGTVYGTISSTNTTPESVWDTAFLEATETVFMRYVWDSATIHVDGTANGAILDANALFSDEGAKLAYNLTNSQGVSTWGIIPGCNEYAGYVTYRLTADQPEFGSMKEVSREGENKFADNINTVPGEVLDFKITYKNSGTTEQKSVTAYDTLPEGMEYVAGSTYLITTDNPTAVKLDDKLFSDGLIIGDFDAGEEAMITYKAKIVSDVEQFECGDTTIYNSSKIATANGTITDQVRIIVSKSCEIPNTGPAEIAMSILIVLVISGGGYYLYRSRRTLKKVTAKVEGHPDSKDLPENPEDKTDSEQK